MVEVVVGSLVVVHCVVPFGERLGEKSSSLFLFYKKHAKIVASKGGIIMKVTKHHSACGRATAYRIIIGSRKARQLGLLTDTADGREIIMLKTKSGILLRPIDELADILIYKNFSTKVYSSGDIFCGEVEGTSELVTWYTSSADKIADTFHKAVDEYLNR